jgi:signal transduction histidine kinase/predicted transcriptional regulator
MFLKDFIQTTNDTVTTQATLQEVVDKMSNDRLHHIVIIENKKPVGLITERDVVRFFSGNTDFSDLAIEYAITDIVMLHHTRLVEYSLSMMLNNNIRKIIVIDTLDEYVGCIEQEDLIYALEEKIEEKELKLHQLTNTGNKAVLISENSTLQYALEMMTTNKLTSLLVTANDKAVGIISESDIIKLAQQNIDQEELVKYFMHSPIVQIDEYKTANDMIHVMQKNKIRRVVVFNTQENAYYTLCSKDIAGIIRGNYTKFLESKFFDTRDTFNALSEYVIELIDIDDEQVIFWTNSITKANFAIKLDDNITKLIDKTTWDKLLANLKDDYLLYETIEIQDRFYQIKGHYGTMTDDKIIKLFLNDVTDIVSLTKKLEDEIKHKDKLLFEQAKMAQMGEMIGSIAHQWRQPLSVITTVASGVSFQKEYGTLQEEELPNKMNTIVDNANYLSETIDTFRNFLKEKRELQITPIQNCIKKALQLTSASLKNNQIKLIEDVDYTQSYKKEMITGELVQVLINIINNAKDAIVLNKIEHGTIYLQLVKNDNNVIITIEDNAGGIPKDVIGKIFDEYFTTKDSQKGTGLGLYMSKKIITHSLDGTIDVVNTPKGAKFTIILQEV